MYLKKPSWKATNSVSLIASSATWSWVHHHCHNEQCNANVKTISGNNVSTTNRCLLFCHHCQSCHWTSSATAIIIINVIAHAYKGKVISPLPTTKMVRAANAIILISYKFLWHDYRLQRWSAEKILNDCSEIWIWKLNYSRLNFFQTKMQFGQKISYVRKMQRYASILTIINDNELLEWHHNYGWKMLSTAWVLPIELKKPLAVDYEPQTMCGSLVNIGQIFIVIRSIVTFGLPTSTHLYDNSSPFFNKKLTHQIECHH